MKFVYLHGFASGPSSKKARYFAGRLAAEGMELLIPDLAAGDFEHLTIGGQLSVIERAVEGGPVSLIGSSLGGYLAALYASQRPDEVRRVVLLAPAFSFSTIFPATLGDAALRQWRDSGKLPVFHYGEGAMRNLGYQLAEDSKLYPDFPDFKQPALLFHGLRDESVPVALSERFAAAHSNVRPRIMDSDHELIDVLGPMCDEAIEFLKT